MASSEAQMKRNDRYHPDETRPKGAAHNDEGCRSALRKPQWADAHCSLNGMGYSKSQCISVENLVKICGKTREIYQFKICPIH